MTPTKTCDAHPGVCHNIERLETSIERKVEMGTFKLLVGVLIVVFTGLFSMQWITHTAVIKIETTISSGICAKAHAASPVGRATK